MSTARRAAVTIVAALILAVPYAAGAASGDPLRSKIVGAFASVHSYKLTVLGNVRSLGVFEKPNRYQMTTMFQGKPIRTVIIGQNYWTYSNGRWQKSGTTSNNLEVDIAGLLRDAKSNPGTPFVAQPAQTQDGKKVGTFTYTFKNGTKEACNYNKSTYRATRCKTSDLTLLYSDYNNPHNSVANPR